MLADYECPTCQECDALEMPAVSFGNCAPQQNESEINAIFITIDDPNNPGEALGGPTDWEQASDWTTALHQSTAGKVRKLTVIGDLAEAEQEIRIVSNRRRVMGTKVFTLNATIDDASDENYEFMRSLECGFEVRIWYGTVGGKLYGDQNAVPCSVIKANAPLDRGQNTFERFEFAFQWEAHCHPPRIDNPML